MFKLDNTFLKKILGVYIILGISLILTKEADKYLNIPIYSYLGSTNGKKFLI